MRIPADVDRPDRVLGPFTARQLAILGLAALLLYGLYLLTRPFLPVPIFLLLAAPLGIAVAMLALGRRDGVALDHLAVAAIRQHLSPRHRVAAPEGVCAAPAWIAPHTGMGASSRGRRPGGSTVSPAPLRLPAERVDDLGGNAGVIDLGGDGLAVIAVCSTVNFSLRTPAEQEALVASFSRYLHSMTAPVQILVRAERLDLAPQIEQLRDRAGGLPHPALEAAARDHADYLAELTAQSDLLRRQVLLVLREPLRTGPAPATATLLPWRRDQGGQPTSDSARHAAEQRLVRRLAEACDLLTAAGITLTPLDAAAATGVLASACNPDTFLLPSADLAAADDVITATSTFTDLYGNSDPPPGRAAPPDTGTRAPQQRSAAASRMGASGPWLDEDDDWDYDDEIEGR
ncbi:PrgI family mobile element protein [Amycolatopsis sp. WQ 127309]|uniref:PrgI family mobile element protein n=1 Tax=Amycolatopsis sp. WQ 127309 TaxID=2932773 RepID=UPI001FF436C2|nr:PrgI family protein [Amycolatopsis sp. WQ 127309]UOZ03421.1 PrgI family protein [Amycolatopsis sp. WQ 127309]